MSTTLDDFVIQSGMNRIDFIKIDVEGAEQLCLDGGKETIGTFEPILMIEVNPRGLIKYRSSAEDLFMWIKRFGYKTYVVRSSGLRRCDELPSRESYYNLFCFPEN